MMFDYSKLRGKIVEKYGKFSMFAKAFGLSEHSLSKKLNGKIFFKQDEIARACALLDIDIQEIPAYFFTLKVQQS